MAEANGTNNIACVFDRVTNQAAPLGSGVRTDLLKHLLGVEWNTWSGPCLAFLCSALARPWIIQHSPWLLLRLNPLFSVCSVKQNHFPSPSTSRSKLICEGWKTCLTQASSLFFRRWISMVFSQPSLVKNRKCFENITIFFNFSFWGLGHGKFKTLSVPSPPLQCAKV